MSVKTKEEIQRLFSQFVRDALSDLPPQDRARYQEEFQRRADELVEAGADGGGATGFLDLVGLGTKGSVPFDEISAPRLLPDFDNSVVQSQLHAAAELYYIYQHERMKVFQVVGVLLRMFHDGRMRVQRGPGARALYLVEKHHPLRYKARDRCSRIAAPSTTGRGAAVRRGRYRNSIVSSSPSTRRSIVRDLLMAR